MKLNTRTLIISVLSSGFLALGSAVAIAQNNNDNTSPGEAGHGTGCSNHVGGCGASQESSFGTYQAAPDSSNGTMQAPVANPAASEDSAPANGCLPASEATPGHCISGGTNN
jgi:hypothetical protein